MFNTNNIRKDFPVLSKKLNGKPIVYFDSACMSLRPIQVIDSIDSYYKEFPACAGRSLHKLGKKVTEEVENSRKTIQKFINAKKQEEIIFTRNTTESINFISKSFKFDKNFKVLSSDREHNSNLLPWQILEKKGIKHEIVKSNKDFTFDLDDFNKKIKGTKLVAIVYTSNLDGYALPVKEIIEIAHENKSLVLLDAAQAVPHHEVDVKKLDVDFLAFSGHKMLGPSGIGILYGKYDLLKELEPFMLGGETVTESTYNNFDLEKIPERFEAGLQNYAGIIGLKSACQYLDKIGKSNIEKHEKELTKYITNELESIEHIELVGVNNPELKTGVISFNIKNISSHEVAMLLDKNSNIMIRSGAHCLHSWFNANNLKGSARASLYLYNTKEEAEFFIEEIKKLIKVLK